MYLIRCCLFRTILTSIWNTFRLLHFPSFWFVCMFICFEIHCVVIVASCTVDSTWNPFNTTIHTDQIVYNVHRQQNHPSLLNIFVYINVFIIPVWQPAASKRDLLFFKTVKQINTKYVFFKNVVPCSLFLIYYQRFKLLFLFVWVESSLLRILSLNRDGMNIYSIEYFILLYTSTPEGKYCILKEFTWLVIW